MKVLVTGAAGFLGSWLAEDLVNDGHQVAAVDNLLGGSMENLPEGVDYWNIDITDSGIDKRHLHQVTQGCEVVYHCAAIACEGLSVFSPSTIVSNVVTGTVNTMVAAIKAGAKRFVNCSSMARYGRNELPYKEEMPCNPVDPYGAAKLAAEQQLNILGEIHSVEVVHAVPHNIIGPRQKYTDPYRNVAAIMINRILQDKPPIIYGDGKQVRCFSYVEDVLSVLTQLGTCKLSKPVGEVYNVGPDDHATSVYDLYLLIKKLTGTNLEPLNYPPRPAEVKRAFCSSEKISQQFGYTTKTSLAAALQSMVNWIKHKGPKPFEYHLPLEISNGKTPCTWKDQLI